MIINVNKRKKKNHVVNDGKTRCWKGAARTKKKTDLSVQIYKLFENAKSEKMVGRENTDDFKKETRHINTSLQRQ